MPTMGRRLSCAAVLLCAAHVNAAIVASGTKLEVRLSTAVGSRVSHPGDRVSTVVIAPVVAGRELLLLQGCKLSGVVEEADPLGLGLKRGAAQLEIRFQSLQFGDGTVVPLAARTVAVETARESVSSGGRIVGIDPAANVSSAVTFLMSTALVHSQLEPSALVFKLLVARSPDSEIYLPPGAEMMVEVSRDVAIDPAHLMRSATPPLATDDLARVESLLQELPEQRAEAAHGQRSDLLNLILLGAAKDVDTAFRAAGWRGESRHSPLSLFRMYHCLIQRMGYLTAPMSTLKFDGLPPTRAYQKSLDTLSKRHHVRFWRQGDTDIWLGAASEDVGLIIRSMHVTHAIDAHIDNERSKVVNDLWFTGCIQQASIVSRPAFAVNLSKLDTDGELAVLRLGHCDEGRRIQDIPSPMKRPAASQMFQAVVDEVMRANPLTVGFTIARAVHGLTRTKPASSQTEAAMRVKRTSTIDSDPGLLAHSGLPGASSSQNSISVR